MSRPWMLVTPASRGLGFALARHLLQNTRLPLVATARNDLSDLQKRLFDGLDHSRADPQRLRVLRLDVTDEDSIAAAAHDCADAFPTKAAHLRLGFVLPGILRAEKAPEKVSATDALDTFRINTVGPLLVAKHFVPFLPRRTTDFADGEGDDAAEISPLTATLALMSARVGSITDNKRGGWFSYRASKAGVTQLAKSLDIHLAARSDTKAMCVALHPGTVRTDLSKGFRVEQEGQTGVFDADDAATKLVNVVKGLGENVEGSRGRFFDWKGEEIPP